MPVATVPQAGQADVDAAVSAARRAFDSTDWATRRPEARAQAILSLADALDKRGEATAQAVSTQNGMPISIASVTEAVVPAMLLRYYAELALNQPIEERRAGSAAAPPWCAANPSAWSPRSCRGTSRRP